MSGGSHGDDGPFSCLFHIIRHPAQKFTEVLQIFEVCTSTQPSLAIQPSLDPFWAGGKVEGVRGGKEGEKKRRKGGGERKEGGRREREEERVMNKK